MSQITSTAELVNVENEVATNCNFHVESFYLGVYDI
jgi:hypothetical protein